MIVTILLAGGAFASDPETPVRADPPQETGNTVIFAPSAPPRPVPQPLWKPGDGPRPPIPMGSPLDWVRPQDYPAEARRAGVGGVSGFMLQVGDRGRVTSCAITQSSGSALLDDQACRLISQRGNFSPALDASGRRVAGSYTNRVRWNPPPPQPNRFGNGSYAYSFILGADGVPYDCRDEVIGTPRGPDQAVERTPCATLPRFEPFRDSKGNAITRRVRVRTEVTVEEK